MGALADVLQRRDGMMVSMNQILRATALTVLLGGLLSGCASTADTSAGPSETTGAEVSDAPLGPEKSGTGEIMHDLAPVADRFPQLAGAAAVSWMSGTLSDDHESGAGLNWIDAVVELTPTQYQGFEALTSDGAPAELPTRTDSSGLSLPLRSLVPPAPLTSSAQLDAELSQDGFETTALLSGDGKTLILMTVFA